MATQKRRCLTSAVLLLALVAVHGCATESATGSRVAGTRGRRSAVVYRSIAEGEENASDEVGLLCWQERVHVARLDGQRVREPVVPVVLADAWYVLQLSPGGHEVVVSWSDGWYSISPEHLRFEAEARRSYLVRAERKTVGAAEALELLVGKAEALELLEGKAVIDARGMEVLQLSIESQEWTREIREKGLPAQPGEPEAPAQMAPSTLDTQQTASAIRDTSDVRGPDADALCNAVEAGDLQKVRDMLEADPKLVNARTGDDLPALCIAVMQDKKDLADLLLAKGAHVNAKTKNGMTALHWAAACARTDHAKLLLGKSADVNAKSMKGMTALHWAATSGNKEIAELLIENGIDVNARLSEGNRATALALAHALGKTEIVKLLIKHGVR